MLPVAVGKRTKARVDTVVVELTGEDAVDMRSEILSSSQDSMASSGIDLGGELPAKKLHWICRVRTTISTWRPAL